MGRDVATEILRRQLLSMHVKYESGLLWDYFFELPFKLKALEDKCHHVFNYMHLYHPRTSADTVHFLCLSVQTEANDTCTCMLFYLKPHEGKSREISIYFVCEALVLYSKLGY